MKSVPMRMSVFNVEKMRNVVGVGSCSAYRISVSSGAPLGSLGVVKVPTSCAANDQGDCNSPGRNVFIERFRTLFSA